MQKQFKEFLIWYNRDDREMLPTPSNKMGFWAVIIIIIAAAVKCYTEINNL